MALTQIRGATQIKDGTITLVKLDSGISIPSSMLADGANFLKRDGSIGLTADWGVGNNKITNLADAVGAQDAVNLRTAQALIGGISIKNARLVVISDVFLTGVQNFDSVTGVVDDIVVLTAQSDGTENGLWQMKAGAWVRPTSWAAGSTQKPSMILIAEGTVYADTKWLCITDGSIVVDTTSTVWQQDLSGLTYTDGDGILLTGSAFSAKLGDGVEFDGSGNIRFKLDGASLARSASGVKIANGTPATLLMANASGVATWNALSGDATISNAGVLSVVNTGASGFTRFSNLIVAEVPGGSINGSNTAFTLGYPPYTGSEVLYHNGVRLQRGAGNDYLITGSNITMLFTPVTGDILLADYTKA